MLVAGIDIGSRSSQTVLLENRRILAYSNIETGPDSVETARESLQKALALTDMPYIHRGRLAYTVATGYGRIIIPFANDNLSEISCHAMGAHAIFPEVRTILDMGGQDCKAIRCDASGLLQDFIMNDKCAGGTGRFFEIIAEVLDLPLEKIGAISLTANGGIAFSTRCAIFAKSSAMRLMRKGIPKAEILAGLHEAVSRRVITLLKIKGIRPELVITGGIAKNIGMVKRIEQKLGCRVLIPDEPQIIGALGAALFARERIMAKRDVEPQSER